MPLPPQGPVVKKSPSNGAKNVTSTIIFLLCANATTSRNRPKNTGFGSRRFQPPVTGRNGTLFGFFSPERTTQRRILFKPASAADWIVVVWLFQLHWSAGSSRWQPLSAEVPTRTCAGFMRYEK